MTVWTVSPTGQQRQVVTGSQIGWTEKVTGLIDVLTGKATGQTVVWITRVIEPIDVLIIEATERIKEWTIEATGHNVGTVNDKIAHENAAKATR